MQGFSLIELAIVLLLISLIVAGIVAGKSLLKSAEVQTVIKDFNTYKSAYADFKLQYGYKPGDFPKGYEYFANGVNTTCGENIVPTGASSEGCNGDGNGYIARNTVTEPYMEAQLAWMHLQLAELVPGVVKFISSFNYRYPRPQVNNVPVANISDNLSGWAFYFHNDSWFSGEMLVLGQNKAGPTGSNILFTGPGLKPKDAAAVDKKMDDGLPAFGKIRSNISSQLFSSPYRQCHSGGLGVLQNSKTYTYTLSYTEYACAVHFELDQ